MAKGKSKKKPKAAKPKAKAKKPSAKNSPKEAARKAKAKSSKGKGAVAPCPILAPRQVKIAAVLEASALTAKVKPSAKPYKSGGGKVPKRPKSACCGEEDLVKSKCAGTAKQNCKNKKCQDARKCILKPYKEKDWCCGKTPHHLVEVHCFTPPGGRSSRRRLKGCKDYDDADAPCVCVEGSRYEGEHGALHAIQNMFELACMDEAGPRSQQGGKDGLWTYAAAKQAALLAMRITFSHLGPKGKGCSDACLNEQLDKYHNEQGITDDMEMRADRSPLKPHQKEWGLEEIDTFLAAPGGAASVPKGKHKKAKR